MKKKWWIPFTAALCIIMIITLVLGGSRLVRESFSELEEAGSLSVRVEAAQMTPRDEGSEDEDNRDEPDQEEDSQDEEKEEDEKKEPEEVVRESVVATQYTDITDGNAEKVIEGDGGDDGNHGGSGGSGSGEADDKKEGEKSDEDKKPTPSPSVKPQDDTELELVTDLANKTLTYDELEDDTLPFYAYLKNNKDDEYSLKIRIKNSGTSQQGTVLRSGNERDYTAKLARGEVNEIDVLILKGGKVYDNKSYYITYQARKADKDHPTVGEHPPVIDTRLDHETGEGSSQNYEFWVSAKDYKNNAIYYNSIEVRLDGKLVDSVSGDAERYTYQLYFNAPAVGETAEYEISVLAWDGEGNSRYNRYKFTYHDIAEGEVIGTAYIYLDASVVGLGMLEEEPAVVEVRQGQPASYDIEEALEYFQYDAETAGTKDSGYYIRRLSRPSTFYGAEIPELLRTIIERDNLSFSSQSDDNSLGEYDFTMSSGWLFTVGGTVYSGKGLSDYYLSDGDTLYLRFTLAYGKDVGGYSSQGGRFTHYCTSWLNGGEFSTHEWGEEKTLQEATCTQDGYKAAECNICGTSAGNIIIPALGHAWKITHSSEPTCTQAGETHYECERCHEKSIETTPALGHDYKEAGRTEPQPGIDGEILYRCERCGDEYTETIPALPVEDGSDSSDG